jgi:hypothetical protein
MNTDEKEKKSENLSKELRELVNKFQNEFGKQEEKFTCKVNADCPPGYVCIYGQCIKIAV